MQPEIQRKALALLPSDRTSTE